MANPMRRTLIVAGRKTSVTIEDAFWRSLKEIAIAQDRTPSELVTLINSRRDAINLSSAIRVFVLEHYRTQQS